MLGLLLAAAFAVAAPRVAVLDLGNRTSDASLDGAGAGLSSVLVSKLLLVDGLEVVERERLSAVLDELKLGQGGAIDPATAARAGKLLGATHIVSGDLVSARLPALSLALRVVEVETGKVVAASEVRGEVGARGEEFFVLVDEATAALIAGLSLQLGARDRIEVGQVEVKGLGAVEAYGRAVTALDRGDRSAAEKALQEALALEPGFRLAEGALARVSAEVAAARQGYAHEAVTSARAELDALELRVAGTLPAAPTVADLAKAAARARVRLARGDLAGALALEEARAAATKEADCRAGAFHSALREYQSSGYLGRLLGDVKVWPWEVRMENADLLLALGRKDEAWTLILRNFQAPGPVFSVTSGPRNPTDWAARRGFFDLAVLGRRQELQQATRLGYDEEARKLLRVVDEAVEDAREAREQHDAWDKLQAGLAGRKRADADWLRGELRATRVADDDVAMVLGGYSAFHGRVRAGFYADVATERDFRDLAARWRSLGEGVWRQAWFAEQRLGALLDYQAAVPARDAEETARRMKELDETVARSFR